MGYLPMGKGSSANDGVGKNTLNVLGVLHEHQEHRPITTTNHHRPPATGDGATAPTTVSFCSGHRPRVVEMTGGGHSLIAGEDATWPLGDERPLDLRHVAWGNRRVKVCWRDVTWIVGSDLIQRL
ncbi:hypothetical protein GQ457_01G011810 [Hibiscus cannabinus]